MDDRTVSEWAAARTAECARKNLELDNRLAGWDDDFLQLMSTSRDVIARSRQLLSEISKRDDK